ncbi:MAG: hypothetical protein ACRDZ1_05690 [Acidimicrobiia bacterium]
MKGTRLGRKLALALVVVVGAGLLWAVPASAAALTNVQWSVSNNQQGATGVKYTFDFTTATTGTVATVDMSVPAGTGGTPSVTANYGIGAGTVALASNTLTYTVTSPASVSAGTPILIEISGLTNTSTLGSYQSNVTTKTSVPATIDGPTASNSVSIAGTNTAVEVVIAKSLTFTNDTASFRFLMDPGNAALSTASKAVALSVLTNATGGYTLTAKDNAAGLLSGTDTIARFTSNGQTGANLFDTEVNVFGYELAVTGATLPASMGSSKYAGYTSAGETIASRTGPTGATADTVTVTNKVKIDYGQDAGTYTDTVVYTATPTY